MRRPSSTLPFTAKTPFLQTLEHPLLPMPIRSVDEGSGCSAEPTGAELPLERRIGRSIDVAFREAGNWSIGRLR
jgi:hypothetical protein